MPPSEKRKNASDAAQPRKRSKPPKSTTPTSLIGPHQDIISELRPKYNVLPASVISSTQIRKRVAQITSHLASQSGLPPVALLYARPAEVCKMITITEQCKRLVKGQGKKTWFQYNQMFEVPAQEKEMEVVEQTVLEGEQEDSSDDGFEVMASRFEKAISPPKTRVVRSMRVFLSVHAIECFKGKSGITLQTSDDGA